MGIPGEAPMPRREREGCLARAEGHRVTAASVYIKTNETTEATATIAKHSGREDQCIDTEGKGEKGSKDSQMTGFR